MYYQPLIGILIFISACTLRINGHVVSHSASMAGIDPGKKVIEKDMLESLMDAIIMRAESERDQGLPLNTDEDANAMQSVDVDVCKSARDPRTLKWPKGTYALLQTTCGCPAGFDVGCIKQDNEDTDNQNRFAVTPLEAEFSDYIAGEFGQDTELCYCVKQDVSADPSFTWQAGRYCIVSKGGCHSGFRHGEIFWHDEDTNNKNERTGVLPDGRFDTDTQLNFCCRQDGDPNQEIVLPTDTPFVLYQTRERGCQKVAGMGVRELYMHMDNEDSGSRSNYQGYIPYIGQGCSVDRDHSLRACYYYAVY